MNIKESIRRILSEETQIPSVIRRRVSSDDIEEAFEFALEQNADSMNNPRSIIFKEKEHTTLRLFSKFVIDDMVTHIEQESFNDDNRIYFSDNEEDTEKYHEQIRKPLLKHYGKRIKERYNEVKSDNINESDKNKIWLLRRLETQDIKYYLNEQIDSLTDQISPCGYSTSEDYKDVIFEVASSNFINHFSDELYVKHEMSEIEEIIWHLLTKKYGNYLINQFDGRICDDEY